MRVSCMGVVVRSVWRFGRPRQRRRVRRSSGCGAIHACRARCDKAFRAPTGSGTIANALPMPIMLLGSKFEVEELPPALLKGKEKPLRIYNVKREKPSAVAKVS